jgi:shikimate dehydrogenase
MSKQYGILAYPAKHSLSPVIHNAAFKALGIDAGYYFFEIPESGIVEFLTRVKNEPIDGLSVSLPYKEWILKLLDSVDEHAERIGAVNTVENKDGVLYGYNSDYIGAVKALNEVVDDLSGKRVAVFGAGGAARAVVYGLIGAGAEVFVFNRTKTRAEIIARDFGCESGSLKDMLNKDFKADILVQASSIWTINPEISDYEVLEIFPEEFVDRFSVVMDVAYSPLITPLLEIAQRLGKKIVTGDRMLLHQAVVQFEIWTGVKAPIEEMEKSLLESLPS